MQGCEALYTNSDIGLINCLKRNGVLPGRVAVQRRRIRLLLGRKGDDHLAGAPHAKLLAGKRFDALRVAAQGFDFLGQPPVVLLQPLDLLIQRLHLEAALAANEIPVFSGNLMNGEREKR